MENLKITLNGKEYTAKNPKAKLFRTITKFNVDYKDKNVLLDENALNALYGLIAEAMGHPEITAERIEEEMDMEDVMPAFHHLSYWVTEMMKGKVKQLPNAGTPAGD